MYIDIPDLERMPEEIRARETTRALRQLAQEIDRTLNEIEMKMEELGKLVEEARQ